MGTTKDNRIAQAARIATKRSSVRDENGLKQVGTVDSTSPFTESRHTRRHPFRVNCTLHTKKWTKARVNHYAKVFGDAVKMKASKTPMEKKSFVRSLVNLFA